MFSLKLALITDFKKSVLDWEKWPGVEVDHQEYVYTLRCDGRRRSHPNLGVRVAFKGGNLRNFVGFTKCPLPSSGSSYFQGDFLAKKLHIALLLFSRVCKKTRTK